MQLNIKNRTALITGASQGIGRKIAIQLAKEGANVAITSNDQAALEQVVSEMAHYAISKAAILSLAKSLANEVGKDGITVNSISPGVIVTPAWDDSVKKNGLTREEYASKFCNNVLAEQTLGQPEDVASLISYLCSESARWITGSNFRIDGGSVKSVQL